MSIAITEQVNTTCGQANGAFVATTIDAAIKSAGFVQTSDSGQVGSPFSSGFPSSGYPYSSPTNYYRIYKFADSLQSTAPFFVKIFYSPDLVYPYVFQFANGTDGAGNLTGSVSELISADSSGGAYDGRQTANTLVNGPANCYFCGSTNRFAMAIGSGPSQSPIYENCIGWERTKDNTGSDTSEGLIVVWNLSFNNQNGLTSSSGILMLPTTPAATDQGPLSYWPAAINQAQNTMATAQTIGAALPIPFNIYPHNPGFNFAIYQGSDLAAYSQQTFIFYNANHNYLVLSPNAVSPTNPTANSHLLMRYE